MRLAIFLAAALIAAGCASPRPLYNPQAPSAGSASLARTVIDKQEVSFHDGMRGVILLSAGRRQDMSFKGCMKYLADNGVVPISWEAAYRENSALKHSVLAYMIVRALGIQGGLTMRVFGTSGRYALRECKELGIIEKGCGNSVVSGREFLSILRRAEEYAKENLNRG
jgi:hypothetical protein